MLTKANTDTPDNYDLHTTGLMYITVALVLFLGFFYTTPHPQEDHDDEEDEYEYEYEDSENSESESESHVCDHGDTDVCEHEPCLRCVDASLKDRLEDDNLEDSSSSHNDAENDQTINDSVCKVVDDSVCEVVGDPNICKVVGDSNICKVVGDSSVCEVVDSINQDDYVEVGAVNDSHTDINDAELIAQIRQLVQHNVEPSTDQENRSVEVLAGKLIAFANQTLEGSKNLTDETRENLKRFLDKVPDWVTTIVDGDDKTLEAHAPNLISDLLPETIRRKEAESEYLKQTLEALKLGM